MYEKTGKTIDLLEIPKQILQGVRDKTKPLDKTREEIINLAYSPGQVVLDTITGEEVTVLDGQRGDYVVQEE